MRAVVEVIAIALFISIYNEFMFLMKSIANQGIINQVVADYIYESGGVEAFDNKDHNVIDKELQYRLKKAFKAYGLDEFIY